MCTNCNIIYSFEDDNAIRTCNEKQYSFLKRAMNLALKSSCPHQRHGCVIVKDNEIVSEGYNHKQTHLYHKFSVHAEVDAISKMKHNRKYMSQCDLYVVRIGTDNMGNPLKYSKPCNGCIKAIEKSGIRRVYYSSNIEFEKMMIERFGFTYGNYNSDSDISTSSISS
jgi:deoxycytidylate deaminase